MSSPTHEPTRELEAPSAFSGEVPMFTGDPSTTDEEEPPHTQPYPILRDPEEGIPQAAELIDLTADDENPDPDPEAEAEAEAPSQFSLLVHEPLGITEQREDGLRHSYAGILTPPVWMVKAYKDSENPGAAHLTDEYIRENITENHELDESEVFKRSAMAFLPVINYIVNFNGQGLPNSEAREDVMSYITYLKRIIAENGQPSVPLEYVTNFLNTRLRFFLGELNLDSDSDTDDTDFDSDTEPPHTQPFPLPTTPSEIQPEVIDLTADADEEDTAMPEAPEEADPDPDPTAAECAVCGIQNPAAFVVCGRGCGAGNGMACLMCVFEWERHNPNEVLRCAHCRRGLLENDLGGKKLPLKHLKALRGDPEPEPEIEVEREEGSRKRKVTFEIDVGEEQARHKIKFEHNMNTYFELSGDIASKTSAGYESEWLDTKQLVKLCKRLV